MLRQPKGMIDRGAICGQCFNKSTVASMPNGDAAAVTVK
jgi:hypothetical protein